MGLNSIELKQMWLNPKGLKHIGLQTMGLRSSELKQIGLKSIGGKNWDETNRLKSIMLKP